MDSVCQRKHKVDGHELEVQKLYECLSQVADDAAEFVVPESIDLKDLDIRKLQFLAQSETSKAAIGRTLADIYAKIVWPKNIEQMKTRPLKVECILPKEMKDFRKRAKNWEKIVIAEVTKFLNLLVVEVHSTVRDGWKPVMEGLHSLNATKPEGVALVVE